MKNRRLMMLSLAAMLVTTSAFADGGVSFSRNRLVFPAQEKSISLTVKNAGEATYLVQAGMSGDKETGTPAPFVVTPPLFRLEARSQNIMRILRTGGNLPTDRESVFYFYANTIPSQAAPSAKDREGDHAMGATLSISMKTILKVFWRPQNLAVAPADAPGMMHFIRGAGAVVVKNPTPYYQSFASLSFDGQPQDLNQGPSMVSPYSELRFPVKQTVSRVTWSVMNDYGGTTDARTQPVTAQ